MFLTLRVKKRTLRKLNKIGGEEPMATLIRKYSESSARPLIEDAITLGAIVVMLLIALSFT